MLTGTNEPPLLELLIARLLLIPTLEIVIDELLVCIELLELNWLDDTWLEITLEDSDEGLLLWMLLDETNELVTDELTTDDVAIDELAVEELIEEELFDDPPDDPPQPMRSPNNMQIKMCFM
jgi:hypothetical protein